MDVKKFFRGPIFWIVLVVILVLFIGDLATRSGGFEDRDTYKVVDLIQQNDVKSAVVIGGTEQEVRITTKDGQKFKAPYVDGQATQLTDLLQEKADNNQLPGGYDVEISQDRKSVV